jgi:hypothetical protein
MKHTDWASRTKTFVIELASLLSLLIFIVWLLWSEVRHLFH